MPKDLKISNISCTIGKDQVVDEPKFGAFLLYHRLIVMAR